MKTKSISIIELKPQVGCWLTQASLASEQDRVFSDSVYCAESKKDEWLQWTNKQRTEWIERNSGTSDVEVLSEEDNVKRAKALVLSKAEEYYNANGYTFDYKGYPLQVDYEMRSKLRSRLSAEKTGGATTSAIWFGSLKLELPIAHAEQLLVSMELYAGKCYDVCQQHKIAVGKLQNVEELEAYDYTANYPERLSF